MSTPALDFEPESHTYTLDGLVVPSVTQVLAPLEDYQGIPPSTLEHARGRGQAVHAACHYWDEEDLDESTLDPEVLPYLEAWIRFRAEALFTPTAIEQIVYSERHRYAGMLDRVGRIGAVGDDALLDIKAVSRLSPVTALQTSAYAEAWQKDKRRRPPRRFAVQLKPDGTYKLSREYKDRGDLSVFLSMLTIHNWKRRHQPEKFDDY